MSIEDLADTVRLRALPQPDHASRHYWEQAAAGQLVVQRCVECGQYQFYPRALCASCAGETEWVGASGRGTLYTYTIIRQNRSEAFARFISPMRHYRRRNSEDLHSRSERHKYTWRAARLSCGRKNRGFRAACLHVA